MFTESKLKYYLSNMTLAVIGVWRFKSVFSTVMSHIPGL